MEEVTEHVTQLGHPTESGVGWASLIENESSFVLVDPCFGWRVLSEEEDGSRSYTAQFEAMLDLLIAREKPVRWIFLTHSHIDRVENLEFINRSFTGYRGRKSTELLNYELIVHHNSPLRSRVARRIGARDEITLDGRAYVFIHTPGHSGHRDDVSLFLPEDKVLFCGDLCQPQGPSYEACDSVTPFQYFEFGDMAISSLERLLRLDFDFLKSASGATYRGAAGRSALEVTLQVLQRLDELARELVRENPRADSATICEWIYDTVCYERGFDAHRAYWRKTGHTVNGKTEYEVFDKPEIDNFVQKYRLS
ncbi:MAG: MBL fold metallo-hydrolase [Candidatus Schekmanbacteria bacterium]|nr:MBL fold metallo-hydrolase [Candidatus Schekmanbacteria bacterium]